MCTIRRARIKKLIKQQRKGKFKAQLFIIDLDAIPVLNESDWHKYFNLWYQKGVLLSPSTSGLEKIIPAKPRKI